MTITDILALTAVILSVVSIVATVIFSLLQQKHNKNSVRPICEIKFSDYENLVSVYLRSKNGSLSSSATSISSGVCTSRIMPDIVRLLRQRSINFWYKSALS